MTPEEGRIDREEAQAKAKVNDIKPTKKSKEIKNNDKL